MKGLQAGSADQLPLQLQAMAGSTHGSVRAGVGGGRMGVCVREGVSGAGGMRV